MGLIFIGSLNLLLSLHILWEFSSCNEYMSSIQYKSVEKQMDSGCIHIGLHSPQSFLICSASIVAACLTVSQKPRTRSLASMYICYNIYGLLPYYTTRKHGITSRLFLLPDFFF